MSSQLETAKYVSFVSFKKDGTPVASPVWIVPFEDGYAFTTDPQSFKIKRITRNPQITLQVCDMRGRVAAEAPMFTGTAVVLDDVATQQVERLISQKYYIGVRLLGIFSLVKKMLKKGATAGDAAIKFTLDPL